MSKTERQQPKTSSRGTTKQGSKFTEKEKGIIIGRILELLKNDKYEISQVMACKMVGICFATWDRWRKEDPELDNEILISRSENLDNAYTTIHNLIKREAKMSENFTITPDLGKTSRWYAERRDPNFKEKRETDVKIPKSLADFIHGKTEDNKDDAKSNKDTA